MRKNVDTMIVVPNERLLAVVGKGIPFQDALKKADEVLLHATQGISSLISVTGLVNVDFADVRTVMQAGGSALMGTGIGRGENRAMEGAQQAISSPLLDNVSISGATGVLVNITGGADLTLGEVHQINEIIHDAVGDDAEIIFGAVHEPAMQGEIRVTVIATGLRPPGAGDAARRSPTSRGAAGHSVPIPAQRSVAGGTARRCRLRPTCDASRVSRRDSPTRRRSAGSQRHGDPDVHSETDGLTTSGGTRRRLPQWWRWLALATARCRPPVGWDEPGRSMAHPARRLTGRERTAMPSGRFAAPARARHRRRRAHHRYPWSCGRIRSNLYAALDSCAAERVFRSGRGGNSRGSWPTSTSTAST